ncbi:MAG: hypothetical protein AB7T06_43165 [Kofleriaceae bacterium]
MEFFKSNNPAYKSARVAKVVTQPAAPSGLSGLIGSLFGSATPAYKTASGRAAKSPSSSGPLSMFAVAPSYKTVPVVVAEGSLDGDELAEAAQVADAGDAGPDDEGAVCELAADEIVLL